MGAVHGGGEQVASTIKSALVTIAKVMFCWVLWETSIASATLEGASVPPVSSLKPQQSRSLIKPKADQPSQAQRPADRKHGKFQALGFALEHRNRR